MENQIEAISTIKQPKFSKKIIAHTVVIMVIIILCSSLGYLYYQNNKLQKLLVQKESSVIDTQQKYTLSMPPVIAMSIQDIANQILTNTLPFSASGSAVPTFTKEFELSQNNIWANQVITVYRYVPGGIIKQGYEGFTWDLNLDNEVKQIKTLSKLDSGTYITPITNSQSEPNLGIVTIKKIGNLAYTTSDSYFPPSRSWSRKYTVFDEKRNQLIYITMNIKPDSQDYSSIKEKTICYEHQCTVIYIFPSEIENFFQEQQDILIGSLAKESLIKE